MNSTIPASAPDDCGQSGKEPSCPLSSRVLDKMARIHTVSPQLNIPSQDESIPLGGSGAQVSLKKGPLGSRTTTYVAKCWRAGQDALPELTMYDHAELLRPLQGVHVPRLFAVSQDAEGALSCAMSTPHSVGWRHAHMAVSRNIREKVILAYERIHQQGILHGHVAFKHILIGDDEEVTIIDFSTARTVADLTSIGLEHCQEGDLRREMRKVKYLFDYEGARERERRLASAPNTSLCKEPDVVEEALDLSELEAMDEESMSTGSRFEIPFDRCSDPSEHDTSARLSLDHQTVQVDESKSKHSEAPAIGSDIQHMNSALQVEDALDTLSVSAPIIHAPKPVRVHMVASHCDDDDNVNASCTSRFLPSSTPPPVQPPSPDLASIAISLWAGKSKADESALYTGNLLDDSSDSIPAEKRTFKVAFHPDTEDNGIWADGRPVKRMKRPPTPYTANTQTPKDDNSNPDPQSHSLSASRNQDINPREPPPYRPTSHSPSASSGDSPRPSSKDQDEVVIVITSPTGRRRVWGVSETTATQISMLLDKRADTPLSERVRQQEAASTPSALKRKADQPPQGSELKSKLLKKSHSFFSKFFG